MSSLLWRTCPTESSPSPSLSSELNKTRLQNCKLFVWTEVFYSKDKIQYTVRFPAPITLFTTRNFSNISERFINNLIHTYHQTNQQTNSDTEMFFFKFNSQSLNKIGKTIKRAEYQIRLCRTNQYSKEKYWFTSWI